MVTWCVVVAGGEVLVLWCPVSLLEMLLSDVYVVCAVSILSYLLCCSVHISLWLGRFWRVFGYPDSQVCGILQYVVHGGFLFLLGEKR